jgi:hypothetical protein
VKANQSGLLPKRKENNNNNIKGFWDAPTIN